MKHIFLGLIMTAQITHAATLENFLSITKTADHIQADVDALKQNDSYINILTSKSSHPNINTAKSEYFQSIDSKHYKDLLQKKMTQEDIDNAVKEAQKVATILHKVHNDRNSTKEVTDKNRLHLIKTLTKHTKDVESYGAKGFEESLIKNLASRYTSCSDHEIHQLITFYSHSTIQKERKIWLESSLKMKEATNKFFQFLEK